MLRLGRIRLAGSVGLIGGSILHRGDIRGSGRGDQHVRVKVLTPQKLSSKQKELLKEFGELSGESVNPEQKSFMDTLRKMFK